MYTYLSIYLFIYLFIYLSIYLSIYYLYLSIYMYIYLYLYVYIRRLGQRREHQPILLGGQARFAAAATCTATEQSVLYIYMCIYV